VNPALYRLTYARDGRPHHMTFTAVDDAHAYDQAARWTRAVADAFTLRQLRPLVLQLELT